MNVLFNAVSWVVGKALAPVTDTVLEDWAASNNLGLNVEALKMELLYVQAMLKPWSSSSHRGGIDDDNPALEQLLQMLRDKAYDAEDLLDELDYFRLQDAIYGTSEAADEHAKGCCRNLGLNTRHTAKAVVGKLLCSSPGASRRSEASAGAGCMRKLISGACNTVRHVGKRLPCSSMPPVRHDDGNHSDGMITPSDDETHETPKLEFNRVDISKRMRLIVEQLHAKRREVSMVLTALGSNQNAAPVITHSRPNTISESIEPRLYGRDNIMESIVQSITQGEYCDKNLTVISIVGHGGIGKTTLAQYIYHHQQVQTHFQVMVWKCVSFDFNVDKLTQYIKEYIPSVEGEKIGTPGELIGQRLKSKRFLLVLDDMWECSNEDEWKRLLLPFKKTQIKGNIILVTTRRPALAEMVSRHQIKLEGLDHQHFKELFLAYVFDDDQSTHDHTVLLETGYKIMDKLKGSPLAAKTVGRLLRNNLDLDHWKGVLESKQWELETGVNDIMPALQLSYDYLPFDLQQCFSYCALFPQDYIFYSKELTLFWIGQNILYSGDQNSLTDEEIGIRKINALVLHGFFKKDGTEEQPHYIIHDLLHDLALKVASHEILSVHIYNVIPEKALLSTRHLSIILDSINDRDKMTYENRKSQLRNLIMRLKAGKMQSLMIFGEMDEGYACIFQDLFGETDALRLLILPQTEYPLVEFFLEQSLIAIHLRYLRLAQQWCDWSSEPLSRFYHLKILDLQKCFGPIDLPRDMCNLLNLSHFLASDDEIYSNISNVGKLQFLEELKMFQVNKESSGFEVRQLGNLTRLRELEIYNLERIHTEEEATEAKIIDKNYLHKLTLVWENMEPDSTEHTGKASYLEIMRPHSKLRELCIKGHGGPSCPTWLGDHISGALRSLHLDGVAWEIFPPLGRMWILEDLTLKNMTTLKEFGPSNLGSITGQSFGKLKMLEVIGLAQLEHWGVLGDTCHLLSQLQVLIIEDCPNLLELPFDHIFYQRKYGVEGTLSWFPNLQVLQVKSCPKVVSLPPIPWTQSLRYVMIEDMRTSLLHKLNYANMPATLILSLTDNHFGKLPEQTLVMNNLKDLIALVLNGCPNLETKHLRMLSSLKVLKLCQSRHVFMSSMDEGEVRWQLPVRSLKVERCYSKAKELREFLSHLPNLKCLEILHNQGKMTGVALEQPSPWVTTVVADKDDGLLILPAHLKDSLEELTIEGNPELSLVTDHIGLHSLKNLKIQGCPKFLSSCTASFSSSYCPFPPSLLYLHLDGVGGMGTLAPLSNLTSLTCLALVDCGEDLRSDGLWPHVTQGLTTLKVRGSPRFFLGSDPVRELRDEYQKHLLYRSSKLSKLTTDDVRFLATPICSLLLSSLIDISLCGHEFERFTKKQDEALQLLTSLRNLNFSVCRKLQCLPAGLHRLPNLTLLQIHRCPSISSLPDDGLPSSLKQLYVNNCGNEELKQQCKDYIKSHPQICA